MTTIPTGGAWRSLLAQVAHHHMKRAHDLHLDKDCYECEVTRAAFTYSMTLIDAQLESVIAQS